MNNEDIKTRKGKFVSNPFNKSDNAVYFIPDENGEAMNNEWKELDIRSVPGDIMVADYELQVYDNEDGWIKEDCSFPVFANYIKTAILNGEKYRYRLKPKKEPVWAAASRLWNDERWQLKDDPSQAVYLQAFRDGAKWQKENGE